MSAQVPMFGGPEVARAVPVKLARPGADLVLKDVVGAGVVVRGPVPPGEVWRVHGRNADGAWLGMPCDNAGADEKRRKLREVDGRHPALVIIGRLPHAKRTKEG